MPTKPAEPVPLSLQPTGSDRPGMTTYPLTWQLIGAAALVMGAGALHFVYAPIHLAEARGQGIFFLMLGFAQLGWGAAVLRNPSPRSYLVGMTMVTVMPSVLYAVTRYIAAPFGDEPEGVDIIGASTFLGETLGAMLLAWHGIRHGIQWRSPDVGPVPLAVILVVAGLVAAGASFGVGLAAEATIPWLDEGETTGHGTAAGGEGHHASAATPVVIPPGLPLPE